MLKEFKQFIMRGNVVDLAIGVIIGAAFSGIVTSLITVTENDSQLEKWSQYKNRKVKNWFS